MMFSTRYDLLVDPSTLPNEGVIYHIRDDHREQSWVAYRESNYWRGNVRGSVGSLRGPLGCMAIDSAKHITSQQPYFAFLPTMHNGYHERL
jgi:hypothetical protein